MLNPYVWNLYLNNGGNKTVELFQKTFEEEFTLSYIEMILSFIIIVARTYAIPRK